DIAPRIINNRTGEIIVLSFGEKKKHVLTDREKEILLLIKDGNPSKKIADILGISIHTVNRHRQNIIEKLSVGNSIEAISAATSMGLL
ncbi:MAG: helix-turn-helix transcriptional regulator, partial [Muribaculaceae bacterium]|nr:helix-turn-helix transcriptional regulator [Muribaculaceae bacterium]